MVVFAFSDNLSAENLKLSAESGLQRLQLLECMGKTEMRFAKLEDKYRRRLEKDIIRARNESVVKKEL